MSDEQDSNDKIHRLFPEQKSGGEDESTEEVEVEGESTEGPEETPETPVESEEDADKVVRVAFGEEESEEPTIEDLIRSLHQEGQDTNRAKFQIFSKMIDEGMVMVTLDPREDDVSVPQRFKAQSELRLNFSHGFRIADFDYDEEGVGASLSFDGQRHRCDIPWEYVYMLYSHDSGKVVVFDPRRDD